MHIPTSRGRYVIGLANVALIGLQEVEKHLDMIHICITPSTNLQTYLLEGAPQSAIKTITVDGDRITRDFAEHMEFFMVDFSSNDLLSVYVVDNNGRRLKVSGTFLLELFQRSDFV